MLHPVFDSDSQESLNFCESLSKLISDTNDADLQVASAELLFDMYAVESHTLSEAQMSYILTTSASATIISDIRKLVSTKVLLKMINKQSFNKPQLLHILENISLSCIVGTDETKPNVDHQEIVYSSGRELMLYIKSYMLCLIWNYRIIYCHLGVYCCTNDE